MEELNKPHSNDNEKPAITDSEDALVSMLLEAIHESDSDEKVKLEKTNKFDVITSILMWSEGFLSFACMIATLILALCLGLEPFYNFWATCTTSVGCFFAVAFLSPMSYFLYSVLHLHDYDLDDRIFFAISVVSWIAALIGTVVFMICWSQLHP